MTVKKAIGPNILDRVIATFDPIRAKARLVARMQYGALSGGYSGASRSRRSLREWITGVGSADADTLLDLPTLRARSRDLSRNSPIAAGAINTAVTNVIGPGLKLRAEVDYAAIGISRKQAKEFEMNAERLWKAWTESVECDATRTQTFAGLQDLVFRSVLESGDVAVLLPMFSRKGSPFGLKVQVVEADRISNPSSQADTDKMAGGIEKDSRGAPTFCHIQRSHPGNMRKADYTWDKVPMFGARTGRRNVLLIGRKLRPGQTRGVPYLAAAIEPLKQLERYTEAELMAAVVSGMFTVAITTDTGDTLPSSFDSDGVQATESPEDYKLGNGAIIGLAKGEDVTSINPGRPNAQFDPFVQAILQQVGMALEIPYELLVKHFSASYSAAQASLLEAWRFFSARREWIAAELNQPIYESFIGEQIAAGRLAAPGFFADPLVKKAYVGAQWIGRPRGHIREDVSIKAAQARIDARLTSRAKEAAEIDGSDWERTEEQLQHEEKRIMEGEVELAGERQEKTTKEGLESEPDTEQGGEDEAT